MEDLLLSYLKEAHTGKERRITGAELGRRAGISDAELRKRVNRLRQKSVPICADRGGYFYAANAAEVYATIRQLERMVSGLVAAMEGLERAMEQFQDDGGKGSS